MALRARLARRDMGGPFDTYRRYAEQRMERGALIATDRGARRALTTIRSAMQAAGLGRMGNAVGYTSDLKNGRGVHRRPGGGWSASGMIFIRSRSARSRGAIEAYTEGTDIRPRRGRWLWIPTDDILRVAGGRSKRQRVTPGNWQALGLDSRIGPLVPIRSVNGYPLLVVRNVGVSLAGKARSARALTKKGLPRKGQMAKEFIVAFVAIPHTSRASRVNVPTIVRTVQADLPRLYAEATGRN